MKKLLLVLALLGLFGTPSWAAHKKKSKKAIDIPPVEQVFHPSTAPLSKRARVFLVAGSAATSAFAREVVEQRQLWLAAGLHEDEIECYYPVPLQEDVLDDARQYLALAPELSKCHAVSVKLLRSHLKELAEREPRPESVYLYFTSHGDRPVSYTLQEAKKSDDDYWALKRESRYPVFDSYQLTVEGLPDGTATGPELYGAMRAGMSVDDLYLTPANLKSWLEPLGDVAKYVVIQGCYSGGFIEDESAARVPTLLSSLPKMTVLTAARHDRSSFGCEPGERTTFYGGAYNIELTRFLVGATTDPRRWNWKGLADSVAARVAKLEKKEKMKPPSLPQYFSNAQR